MKIQDNNDFIRKTDSNYVTAGIVIGAVAAMYQNIMVFVTCVFFYLCMVAIYFFQLNKNYKKQILNCKIYAKVRELEDQYKEETLKNQKKIIKLLSGRKKQWQKSKKKKKKK